MSEKPSKPDSGDVRWYPADGSPGPNDTKPAIIEVTPYLIEHQCNEECFAHHKFDSFTFEAQAERFAKNNPPDANPEPHIPIPASLAQRILAALEREATYPGANGTEWMDPELAALAAELRAVIA